MTSEAPQDVAAHGTSPTSHGTSGGMTEQDWVAPWPTPFELWQKANGDRDSYIALMREHGHIRPAQEPRCKCSCGCHNTSHSEGCREPTGDIRVEPEYREVACFNCLVVCDG